VEPSQPAVYGGSDTLAGLRHRWWLVALVTGLGLVAAGGWIASRPALWESATSVLVHPAGQDTNVVGGRTRGEVNLDTEAQLVGSTAVTAGAAKRLGLDPVPDDLAQRVRVEVPPNTSVLSIRFTAGTPAGAQAGARAFAEAYLAYRERSARAELTAQRTAIEATLAELERTLGDLNGRLAVTQAGTAAAANLASERETVLSQVNTLTERRNELATATVSPGTVISDARLPGQPSRPRPAVVLASGAALGLVVGTGAAGLADRLSRRVRRPGDLPRRLGIPVLAGLPAGTAPPAGEIASPYGPAGRTFDRLRNELIAAAEQTGAPAGIGRGRVIVVASPTGPAAGPVAVNLAASLARSGHEVVLIGTAGPGAAGPLTRLFGIAAAPGLSELLAGRTSLADTLQRPPRFPRLRVMTMGGTATATGLLQSPALRTVLTAVAGQAGYVLVEAPATGTSADAQSLASHADLALLAVEARRTRLADVADAAAQLRQVGTPLVGAVVVPPRRRPAPPPDDGYEAAARDGAGPAPRPPVTAPRRTEAPAPRPPEDRTDRPAQSILDGQPTLVMARITDDPAPAVRAPGEPAPPPLVRDPAPARRTDRSGEAGPTEPRPEQPERR
jgi:Mrp family chromosome partitioning ATPase